MYIHTNISLNLHVLVHILYGLLVDTSICVSC